MQKWSKSDHWLWNYDTGKSLKPKSVMLRNRQTKCSSYTSYWRVACFKHTLMTLINFLCVYFSDVEKIGETDFIEKPKSIYRTPFGFGTVAAPEWTSSNVTHYGRGVDKCSLLLLLHLTSVKDRYLPCNFVAFGVVLQSDGEVSTFIKLSETRWRHAAWFEGSCIWRAGHLKTCSHTVSHVTTHVISHVTTHVISRELPRHTRPHRQSHHQPCHQSCDQPWIT